MHDASCPDLDRSPRQGGAPYIRRGGRIIYWPYYYYLLRTVLPGVDRFFVSHAVLAGTFTSPPQGATQQLSDHAGDGWPDGETVSRLTVTGMAAAGLRSI